MNNTKKKQIFSLLIIIFLGVVSRAAFAEPRLVISREKLDRVDPKGRVYVAKILDNSRLLLVSERQHEGAHILVTSSHGMIMRRIKTPVEKIEYLAVDEKGDKAVFYSQQGQEFFLADLRRGKLRSIFRMEPGKKGFALFGKRESWLSMSEGRVFARGYYYDGEGNYINDNLVQILPDETGIAVFRQLAEIPQLMGGAQAFCNQAKLPGIFMATGKYILFTTGDKEGGVLLAYDTEEHLLHKIDSYRRFIGMSAAEEKPMILYIVQREEDPELPGELVLFDLASQKTVNKWHGRFFNPVICLETGKIAAGELIRIMEGRYLNRVTILSTDPEDKSEPQFIIPTFKLLDWKFVRDGRELYFFTGEEIYRDKV